MILSVQMSQRIAPTAARNLDGRRDVPAAIMSNPGYGDFHLRFGMTCLP